MEKTFKFNVGQSVLCDMVSDTYYGGNKAKVYKIHRQLPLSPYDYEIITEDGCTYPVYESELVAYVSEDEKKLQALHDEMHKEKPLTPRQQWLRRLLDYTYQLDDEKSLSQKEVYDAYLTDLVKPDGVIYPEWDETSEKSFEYSSATAREIRKDFKAIKTSGNTQGIYISSVRGYKRANQKEALVYLSKRKIELSLMWKQFWEIVDRNDKDGQMRIKLTEHQKDTYDPFMTYRKEQ